MCALGGSGIFFNFPLHNVKELRHEVYIIEEYPMALPVAHIQLLYGDLILTLSEGNIVVVNALVLAFLYSEFIDV